MDKSEQKIGRCGRRRGDGNRCDQQLIRFYPTGDGRWGLLARRAEAQAQGLLLPGIAARFFKAAERWTFDCHPRCGARYELLNENLEALESEPGDFYLADAVQTFKRAS
jgi:hypothetical protein